MSDTAELQGPAGKGPGISGTYLEKPESRDIILNSSGGLRERDLFGLGVEERVDQGNDKGRRILQKPTLVLTCFNRTFEY